MSRCCQLILLVLIGLFGQAAYAACPDPLPPPYGGYPNREVCLQWTFPTKNTDGTDLIDGAGIRIYWSTVDGDWSTTRMFESPDWVTDWMMINESNLPFVLGDIYYFAASAYNIGGEESVKTGSVSKKVKYQASAGTINSVSVTCTTVECRIF